MSSTEIMIKDAARTLFLKQGYAATTTRDIAKASNTNVALINYYYRSKQNLFSEIMLEQLRTFLHGLATVVNDPTSDLQTKYEHIADVYITMLEEHPDTPLFVITELQRNPDEFVSRLEMGDRIKKSVLFKQIEEAIERGEMIDVHPVHVIMNLLSMLVFPFMSKPMLMGATGTAERTFTQLMRERRAMVPQWMSAMFTPR